VTKSLQLRL